jgi:hypothetical protein
MVIRMQRKPDRLTALPRPQAAANGEFAKVASVPEKSLHPRVAGWDPYEVWRTRMKAQETTAGKSGRGQ